MTAPGPGLPRRPADRVAEAAATVADEVWADAVAEARRRAGDRLADLLTDAILRALLAEGTSTGTPPPTAPGPAAPPPKTRPSSTPGPSTPGPSTPGPSTPRAPAEGPAPETDPPEALYVYAVTRSGVPAPAAVGLDGHAEVVTVGRRDVALVVSRVAPDLLAGLEQEPVSEEGRLATLVRRHDAVVTAAFGQAPVLPLRFGTLLRDQQAAEQLVDRRYALLDEQLDHLAGRAEYGVRVVERDRADPSAEAVTSEDPSAGSDDTGDHDGDERGTAYLARRRDELAAREEQRGRRADVLAASTEQLDAHAVESVTGRGGQDGVLLDVAYLVASERRDDFLSAVGRESERLVPFGLAVEVQGPWPPYSFARVELGPEATRA